MSKPTVLAAAAAAALVSGCAVYDAPVTEGGAYYGYYSQPYYSQPYYYGSGPYYRDRDGDGIPDRYDARPNNPYRR